MRTTDSIGFYLTNGPSGEFEYSVTGLIIMICGAATDIISHYLPAISFYFSDQ